MTMSFFTRSTKVAHQQEQEQKKNVVEEVKGMDGIRQRMKTVATTDKALTIRQFKKGKKKEQKQDAINLQQRNEERSIRIHELLAMRYQ